MKSSAVVTALKSVLANSYALYVKTQNFHWNVEGPNFKSLHVLFEEQYRELIEAIDEIAERIRTLGEKAPGTFTAFQELNTIPDGNNRASAEVMVKELEESQKAMVAILKKALEEVQKNHDDVTTDLLIRRITVHEKGAWMLRSSI